MDTELVTMKLYDEDSLNPYRGRALYRGVEALIRNLISEGRVTPGDLIPPEPELAAALGVSQGTVKKAIANLVVEGLLYRHQGKGTYVSKVDFQKSLFRFFTYGDARGRAVRIEKRTMRRQRLKGPLEITRRIRCPDGADLVRIDRTGLIDGQSVLVEESWWPAEIVPGLEDERLHIPDYLYALVLDRYGVQILRAEETLSADSADADTASTLGIAEGAPVILLHRLSHSSGDRIVEFRTTRGRADRFSYKSEIR